MKFRRTFGATHPKVSGKKGWDTVKLTVPSFSVENAETSNMEHDVQLICLPMSININFMPYCHHDVNLAQKYCTRPKQS